MNEIVNLTELEIDVLLNGFGKNDFFDGIDSLIWSDMIGESTKTVKGKQVSGVISSLVKKEIMLVNGSGKDAAVCLTKKGKEVFSELKKRYK